jgi:hypothetical protein
MIENIEPNGEANPIGNIVSGNILLRRKAAGIRTANMASVL